MDSSFLNGLHLVLTLSSIFMFLKQLRVFGISNDAMKVIAHLSSGSFCAYFVLLSLYDFEFISAWSWHRFHVIPMVIWSSTIILQLCMMVGGPNYQLHKTLTRIPILLSLVVLAWGSHVANQIALLLFISSIIVLIFSKGHRQQRRTLAKLFLFLFLSIGIGYYSLFWGELFLLIVAFYLSVFQNNFCIQSKMNRIEANS